MPNWPPGDRIVLREVWEGKVWAARPVTVVRDDADLIALYLPKGTKWKRPVRPDGSRLRMPSEPWVLADDVWRDKSVLHLVRPGAAHAVWAMWDAGGKFLGWYVNLQEPLRRTVVGFDYMDQMLDLVVSPDLSEWHLKDEEELEQEVVVGLMTRIEADGVRAEAERVIKLLEERASPFSDGWEAWRPEDRPPPELLDGWDEVG